MKTEELEVQDKYAELAEIRKKLRMIKIYNSLTAIFPVNVLKNKTKVKVKK